MGSPSAQKDENMRLEVVCAVIQENIQEKEKLTANKPGGYTIVQSQGRKEDIETRIAQSLEQVIQAGAIDNECGYDSKNNTMVRIVNGKETSVRSKNSFKNAYKEMKEKGKIYSKNSKDKDHDVNEK